MAKGLSVESVEHAVTGAIRDTGASMGLAAFAVLEALTAEGALIDFALVGAAEGHSVMLQLNDGTWRFLRHVFNGVLITQPVGAFDGVIVMPPPVVLAHVAQGGVDATLSSHCVGSRGEELGDASGFKTVLNKTYCGTKTGTSRSNNQSIISVVDDFIAANFRGRKRTRWLH